MIFSLFFVFSFSIFNLTEFEPIDNTTSNSCIDINYTYECPPVWTCPFVNWCPTFFENSTFIYNGTCFINGFTVPHFFELCIYFADGSNYTSILPVTSLLFTYFGIETARGSDRAMVWFPVNDTDQCSLISLRYNMGPDQIEYIPARSYYYEYSGIPTTSTPVSVVFTLRCPNNNYFSFYSTRSRFDGSDDAIEFNYISESTPFFTLPGCIIPGSPHFVLPPSKTLHIINV